MNTLLKNSSTVTTPINNYQVKDDLKDSIDLRIPSKEKSE